MKKRILLPTLLPGVLYSASCTNGNKVSLPQEKGAAQWFKDAKLGIFIHWGIYSVNSTGASWPIFNKQLTYDEYIKQTEGFTASEYNPEKWAELFKESGARYAVLTSKHHDGVALWDTKVLTNGEKLSVVTKTPAKRDLVAPFVEAMRKAGIHPGLYYSWLDWSNEDYASLAKWRCDDTESKRHTPENLKKWKNFIKFDQDQLEELSKNYKPDLFWFDGEWDASDDDWNMKKFRKLLKTWLPNVTLNSRMKGFGDYKTPEQGIPITPPEEPWELCMTMNSAWGYMENDTKHKSLSQLIRIFIECVSMGGNFLLNIGPKPDGTIRKEQVNILKGMGKWNQTYEEAIFNTNPGPSRLHYSAPCTISKDKKYLYLFVFDKPVNGILFKGLINTPKQISLLATGESLNYERIGGAPWLNVPGVLFINTPENLKVGHGTVVKIELNEPLKLYTGSSGAIEQN